MPFSSNGIIDKIPFKIIYDFCILPHGSPFFGVQEIYIGDIPCGRLLHKKALTAIMQQIAEFLKDFPPSETELKICLAENMNSQSAAFEAALAMDKTLYQRAQISPKNTQH